MADQQPEAQVADAELKALYVEYFGSDKGWLGIEGSYFIAGNNALRAQVERLQAAGQVAAPAMVQLDGPTEAGWYWMKREHEPDDEWRVEKVREYAGKLCIMNSEYPNGCIWIGPLPMPINGLTVVGSKASGRVGK